MTSKRKRWHSYEEYLKSNEWKSIRSEAVKRDHKKCAICEDNSSLQVHHFKYPKDWNDDCVENVITICEDCHGIYHNHCHVHINVCDVDSFVNLFSVLNEVSSEGYDVGKYLSLCDIADSLLQNKRLSSIIKRKAERR